jgi:acetate kinase
MAAVREGQPIDTTMAFTPTAGLVMSTRCGDIDPGLLVYLMRSQRLTVDAIDELVNSQSGLLGVSETSSDMRDLLEREKDDPRAADAIDLFCYQARKWIGAFAAALGGLDLLVFSAGIGENAPPVRARICEGLEFLGVRLDESSNRRNAAVISVDRAPVSVRVIPTDEELVIARSVESALGGAS